MRSLLKALFLPPGGLFLLAAIGLLLARRHPRTGRALVVAAALLLLLGTLPVVGAALLIGLQQDAPLDLSRDHGAQAIVVLSGDLEPRAPEYGGPSVGMLTLERMRYAAHLARATRLPLLVTGGVVEADKPPVARVMAATFQEDFGLDVRWVEDRSRNTRENADLTAQILRREGIRRVLLVTHAWHMPRAKAAFAAAGLEVVAAPMGFRGWPDPRITSFLPSARALRETYFALHEWVGRAWYALS